MALYVPVISLPQGQDPGKSREISLGIEYIGFPAPGECNIQAQVVQKLDSAIHWINHYPVNKYQGNQLHYPLDRDLSAGQRYPPFEQLGPEQYFSQKGKGVGKIYTMEPRFNKPLPVYNEVLSIKKDFLYPSDNKIYGKVPRYNETLLQRTRVACPLALFYIEDPL